MPHVSRPMQGSGVTSGCGAVDIRTWHQRGSAQLSLRQSVLCLMTASEKAGMHTCVKEQPHASHMSCPGRVVQRRVARAAPIRRAGAV